MCVCVCVSLVFRVMRWNVDGAELSPVCVSTLCNNLYYYTVWVCLEETQVCACAFCLKPVTFNPVRKSPQGEGEQYFSCNLQSQYVMSNAWNEHAASLRGFMREGKYSEFKYDGAFNMREAPKLEEHQDLRIKKRLPRCLRGKMMRFGSLWR